jgi:hypothetical protein
MRLKADIWVKAYLRAVQGSGAMAVVVRHGDDDAGTVFVKVSRLDGTATLYGPAPAGLAGEPGQLLWTPLVAPPGVPEAEVDARLAREAEFDSDLWIVEVEDRAGRHFLEDWLSP